ncbi:hypothetical protein ASU31_08535 [Pedobacter ginsenosidimutans]|uniref:Uncharacterized protein n=1 Tax=Pedobacter ginsenosidimutans TaxID=687842 RepID=A0A0T5VQS2_9SPHI|nr:hypothetical protein ASU31_08535 [Pedobacter ginsenosidimutans]
MFIKQINATAILVISNGYIGLMLMAINSPASQLAAKPLVYSIGSDVPFTSLVKIGKNNIKTKVSAAKKSQIDCILCIMNVKCIGTNLAFFEKRKKD